MLGLVAWLLSGFYIDGFWSALMAWFIVAVTHAAAGMFFGKQKS
jgi:putative membrane protein